MTGAEAKKLSKEELVVEINRLREKLFQLRNQAQTEKVEDTSQFRKLRRDLARLLTERTARHAPAPAAKPAPAPAAKARAPRAAAKPRAKA